MVSTEVLLEDASIVLTLLLLEAVLSFDNAAILAVMARKLPVRDRKKALLYGLVGAYALRFAAIVFASFLIRYPELKVIGGGYLIGLGLKHFYGVWRHRESVHKPPALRLGKLTTFGIPALVVVIIQIELIDLAFAIDQVIVAVAFTPKIPLIVIASFVGILFLRLAAAVIARVMDWLPSLEHMAYVAVTYVGAKLLLAYPISFINHGHGVELSTTLSIGVTLAMFLVPILVKLLFDWPKSVLAGSHVATTTAETPRPAIGPAQLQAAHKDVKDAPRVVDGVSQPPRQPPET